MAYYIGIDGGGSKTTCAVGDESAILAAATAGPSNVVRVGEAQARASLHRSVQQACAAAGITPAQVIRTCIGAAGAARAEVVSAVRRALGEILASPIDVLGDMEIALEAAFGGGAGVVVIAGTGSIAYGRNQQGTTARAGGHGAATSDEGSGHWIGKRAVAAVVAQWENSGNRGERRGDKIGHDTSGGFASALQKTWGVESVAELARTTKSEAAPSYAVLFPAVLAAAEAGDDLARGVLAEAARELAKLAMEVILQIFSVPSVEPALVPVAMVGGVFRHAALVREVFYNELREFGASADVRINVRIDVKPQVVHPIEGALRIARKGGREQVSS